MNLNYSSLLKKLLRALFCGGTKKRRPYMIHPPDVSLMPGNGVWIRIFRKPVVRVRLASVVASFRLLGSLVDSPPQFHAVP